MVKNLVNKSEFARLAGVSPAAVTKVTKTLLRAALIGNKIDIDHASAVAYLTAKEIEQTPALATGIDPRYEEGLKWCRDNEIWSARGLHTGIGISRDRATNIIKMAKLANLDKTKAPQEPDNKRVVSGQESVRVTKKQASLKDLNNGENIIHEIPEDITAFAEMTLRELIERFGTDTAFIDWLSATQKIEAINEKRLKNATTKGELISRTLVKNGVIDVFNSAHLRLLKDGAKSIAAGTISKHSSGAELAEIEAFVSDILGSFIKPIKNKIARILKDV